MKVGERMLLPAVRSAPKDALIVADGFSCRTQIGQTTDRHALHLADVIEMAQREGAHGPAGDYPERSCVSQYGNTVRFGLPAAAIGVLGAATLGYALWKLRQSHALERS